MLLELDIENFAVARHVRLRLGGGLTAITGETGAGKSILLDALSLLLGARAESDFVRYGAGAARVEGVFELGERQDAVRELLDEHGLAAAGAEGALVISREVPAAGRSVARVGGRAASQTVLAALGQLLVDLHGQTGHLALLRSPEQLAVIDRYAELGGMREEFGGLVARLRAVRHELRPDGLDERERARTRDRLAYEIDEIAAVAPSPGEDDALGEERRVLGAAEELARLAGEAHEALSEAAADAAGIAVSAAEAIARIDSRFEGRARDIAALQDAIAEAARAARDYRDAVDLDPERLRNVEVRLIQLKELARKYGPTIADVLAYAERAAAERAALAGAEERLAGLAAEEERLLGECATLALAITERRRAAAPALCRGVEAELASFGLPDARFGVRLTRRAAAGGLATGLPLSETVGAGGLVERGEEAGTVAFTASGVDEVEFVVAMNRGEPLRSVARVASGGETSRLILALKSVLREQDPVATLVFDEVEVGLGARTGGVVGQKLAAIAKDRQVLCITHLPQVAAWADTHLVVRKSTEDGRASVEVRAIDGEERIIELADMLGGDTPENRESARALLAARASAAARRPR